LKHATTTGTTKTKVAMVRAEPKTIGTADVNTSAATKMAPFEWPTQHFIRTMLVMRGRSIATCLFFLSWILTFF